MNEIYEEVKSKLEQKNVTLEHIFFTSVTNEEGKQQESLLPTQNVTKNGVMMSLAKLQIILTTS